MQCRGPQLGDPDEGAVDDGDVPTSLPAAFKVHREYAVYYQFASTMDICYDFDLQRTLYLRCGISIDNDTLLYILEFSTT